MIKIQSEDFDPGIEAERLRGSRTDVGASVAFVGYVREFTSERRSVAMTLEHYPGMTEQELTRIEKEARRRWRLLDCLIIHRIGRLAAGDRIVLVLTLSAHRKDAFEAAEFIMDYLKTEAPFWKKEQTAAGEHWVEADRKDDEARIRWKNDE